MNKWFVTLTFLFFVTTTICVHSKRDICELVSTFDAVCKQSDNLIVLSADPCKSPTSISLTIIDFKSGEHKYKELDGDTKVPVPIWGTPGAGGKGVVLVQHVKPGAGDDVERYYRHARLHVMLYLVDIKTYTEDAKVKKHFLSVFFPMFTSDCSQRKFVPPSTLHHSVCRNGRNLGNFSSFCVVAQQNSGFSASTKKYPIPPGVYIIIADVCTMPYSVTILSLLFSGYTLRRKFTQDKGDKYLALPPDQSKCGLALRMRDHYGMHISVQLLYGCGIKNITVIDRYIGHQSGVICPLSHCVSPQNELLAKSCNISWILEKDRTIEAHIEVKLDICEPEYRIWWNYHVHEKKGKHKFKFSVHQSLHLREQMAFHIGFPRSMHNPVPSNDGYLYLDWGTVSLFLRGTDDLVFVTVFRHYPYPNDSVPLFRTEYWIKDLVKKKGEFCSDLEDKSLKTGLPIAGVGLFVFVVVIIFLYWRHVRRHRRREGGLPYAIHMGEMDGDEDPYEESKE